MSGRANQSLNNAIKGLIRERLLWPVLIVSIVVLAITGFYGGRLIESQLIGFSRSVDYAAEEFLVYAENELNTIAQLTPRADQDALQASMEASWYSHAAFDTFYLLDQTGIIQLLVPHDPRYIGLDMSRQSYFVEVDCSAGTYISHPFISLRTGQPTVYLSRCVANGGVLVGELNLGALQAATDVGQEAFSQAIVFIVDQDGTLLAHPSQTLVDQQTNIGEWAFLLPGQVENPTAYYYRDGRFWIGTSNMIQPTGWVVIAEVPILTIYGSYLSAILVLVILLAVIFTLMARGLVHQFQIRLVYPLAQLSDSTDALGSGDYALNGNLSPNPDSYREINHLVENFQSMSQAIIFRETLLKSSEEQYRRLVELSPDAIIVHSNARIVYANTAALKLYAANTAADMINRSIFDFSHPDSQSLVQEHLDKLRQNDQAPPLPRSEQRHIRLDQSVFDAEVTTSTIVFNGQPAAQAVVRDITARKSEEQRLKYLATHDYLTDLPNRFLFQDRLSQALAKSQRNGFSLAVLYLDLDNFKEINDAFGHSSGDQVLQQISDLLEQVLRDSDTVARIGGDEFVILLDYLADPRNAAVVAEKILQVFSAPISVQGNTFFLSWSIGISLFPTDGKDAQVLMQAADAAMYYAKEQGKNRFTFFASDMRSHSLERLSLASQLRHALSLDEFFLEYQPQINSATGELIGVEALIRWQHPELGLVPPGSFISLAEETGLILSIGEWVLQMACEQGHQWQQIKPLRVAINLTDRQLKQPDISEIVRSRLADTGFSPHLLEVELTENIIFRNASDSFRCLYALKDLGLQLAVDDFGTGYSTLGYLAHFPFDRLKIDQRLAPNIASDPKDAALVAGIITIGQNLGMQVIAEGVETAEQRAFYEMQGCFDFQGWYYSRAVSAEKISTFLDNTFAKIADKKGIS